MPHWDAFISHAGEDKAEVAQPLATELQNRGLSIWYDAFTLTIGDRLRRSIEHGLASSRFGILILSPHFLNKEWPQKELDGLWALEADGTKVILPVWHRLTYWDVAKRYPMLADRIAGTTSAGIAALADQILRAVRGSTETDQSPTGVYEENERVAIADALCKVESVKDGRMGTRERTYEFLAEVASDARILADVWQDLVNGYSEGLANQEWSETLRAKMRAASFNQFGVFGELQVFQWFTETEAVSGEAVEALNRIAWGRKEARSVIDTFLKELNQGNSAVNAGAAENLGRLYEAVTELNAQAGRLSAMVKLFKATL